jgi:hypothetical protein
MAASFVHSLPMTINACMQFSNYNRAEVRCYSMAVINVITTLYQDLISPAGKWQSLMTLFTALHSIVNVGEKPAGVLPIMMKKGWYVESHVANDKISGHRGRELRRQWWFRMSILKVLPIHQYTGHSYHAYRANKVNSCFLDLFGLTRGKVATTKSTETFLINVRRNTLYYLGWITFLWTFLRSILRSIFLLSNFFCMTSYHFINNFIRTEKYW